MEPWKRHWYVIFVEDCFLATKDPISLRQRDGYPIITDLLPQRLGSVIPRKRFCYPEILDLFSRSNNDCIPRKQLLLSRENSDRYPEKTVPVIPRKQIPT